MFVLDPAFDAGSAPLESLALCEARLQLDARFSWLILIPRLAGLTEIEDLPRSHRTQLMDEIVLAGRAVRALGEAIGRPVAKLNIASLGNLTPQLHVHVVGRRPDDDAWPGPVWGVPAPRPYDPEALRIALATARALSDEVATGSSIRKRSKCLILEQIISDQMIPSGRSLL